MPTTNAPLAKLALIELLEAQTGPGQLLGPGQMIGGQVRDTIDVLYAWSGKAGPISIYGGGWRFTAEDAVAEGPGLLVREAVTLSLYVRVVARPACDVRETDAIAAVIVDAVGKVLMANPKLAGGLSVVGIAGGQGDYGTPTDDETISIQALQVLVESNVTWG